MSKKKTTTNQTQNSQTTASYGYQPGASSADIDAVRDFKFTADPSIGYAFANAKNQIGNSFNNPLGGLYNGNMRDAILRSTTSNLAMQESQAKSEANQALQGQRFGQKSAVAGLTAPRFVQTGGTSSGTSSGQQVYSPSTLDTIGQVAGIGAGVAA